jgi:hypothetical protein
VLTELLRLAFDAPARRGARSFDIDKRVPALLAIREARLGDMARGSLNATSNSIRPQNSYLNTIIPIYPVAKPFSSCAGSTAGALGELEQSKSNTPAKGPDAGSVPESARRGFEPVPLIIAIAAKPAGVRRAVRKLPKPSPGPTGRPTHL